MLVCLPLIGCLQSSCVWSYPPKQQSPCSLPTPTPPNFYPTPLPHRRQNLSPQTCHTPNPFHPSPLLSPQHYTIIHAPIWCRGRSPSTGPRAACSLSGIPSGSCSAYATTQFGLGDQPEPGKYRQQLRGLDYIFPVPADLQANAGPAARDAFKRATDARAAWLACSAAFCVAILDSIGESNRLAISRNKHPSFVPARHHQCDDCSPRGTDGCRSRRLASASKEKAFSTC